jgi:hypothetical protein
MGYIAALYMAVLGKPGRVLPYSAPKQQGRSEKHRDDGAMIPTASTPMYITLAELS